MFKEWMKKFVALLIKEKFIRMNGKMTTLEKLGQFFSIFTG